MATFYEPTIVYAKELEKNRFALLLRMALKGQNVYLGGIAVIGDIHQEEAVRSTHLRINWIEYTEFSDPANYFLAKEKKKLAPPPPKEISFQKQGLHETEGSTELADKLTRYYQWKK